MRQDRIRVFAFLNDIAAYVIVCLLAVLVFFVVFFRPHNPWALPGFEEKLILILLVAAAVTIVASAISGLPLLAKLYALISRSRFFQRITSSPAGRAVKALTTSVTGAITRRVEHSIRWTTHHLDPSRHWFFTNAGIAIYLATLPLVFLQQKEFVSYAFPLLVIYALLSLKKNLDNRVLVVSGLLFLASCPVFLSFKQETMAELSAIVAYANLATGVLLQFADYLKNRDRYGSD